MTEPLTVFRIAVIASIVAIALASDTLADERKPEQVIADYVAALKERNVDKAAEFVAELPMYIGIGEQRLDDPGVIGDSEKSLFEHYLHFTLRDIAQNIARSGEAVDQSSWIKTWDDADLYSTPLASRIDGDRAIVIINGVDPPAKIRFQPSPVWMIRVDGKWRIVPGRGGPLAPHGFTSELIPVDAEIPGGRKSFADLQAWFADKANELTKAYLEERGEEFAARIRQQKAATAGWEEQFGGIRWDDGWVTGLYGKNRPIDDDDLAILHELPHLKSLYLTDTQVTDAGLDHVAACRDLEHLYLGNTAITDAGLAKIKRLTKLRNLWIHGTAVTDAGVWYLQDMTQMGYLDLGDTRITDRALDYLDSMSELYYLSLWSTEVTGDAMRRLAKKLPRLRAYNGWVTVESKGRDGP